MKLVLDGNFIGHRARHSMPANMQGRDGSPSNVIYGALTEILHACEKFTPQNTLVVWDGPANLRRREYKEYKADRRGRRRQESHEENVARKEARYQMNQLKDDILPAMGLQVVSQTGMEGDDIIARLVRDFPGQFIVIARDNDLFQLLDDCEIYDPQVRKMLTENWLMREYGIGAEAWAEMKSIAGCPGDHVPGCPGVAKTTAIKYLREELNPKTKAYQKIEDWLGSEEYWKTRRLVHLPMAEAKSVPLQPQYMPDALQVGKVLRQWDIETISTDQWIRAVSPG